MLGFLISRFWFFSIPVRAGDVAQARKAMPSGRVSLGRRVDRELSM